MGEPKKAKDTWAHQFTDSSYVAYTTILEPRGARAQRHDKVSVQAVDYDDVMTSVGDDFRRMRVAVGDYVLMYNDDMEDVPYAAVVRGIELLPKSRWPAIDAASGGDPSERLRAAGGADAAWLARQEAEGRLPAKYFVLRVQYFYRYHELMGALGTRGDCNQQLEKVEKSLERLGLRPPAGRVGARAGGAALEQVARYLVYSNHVSTGDERNPHVPLASVVNTSRVYFLARRDRDPFTHPPPGRRGAAAAAAAPPPPGFLCNLFYDVTTPEGDWAVHYLDGSKLDASTAEEAKALMAATREELGLPEPPAAATAAAKPSGARPPAGAAGAGAAAARASEPQQKQKQKEGGKERGSKERGEKKKAKKQRTEEAGERGAGPSAAVEEEKEEEEEEEEEDPPPPPPKQQQQQQPKAKPKQQQQQQEPATPKVAGGAAAAASAGASAGGRAGGRLVGVLRSVIGAVSSVVPGSAGPSRATPTPTPSAATQPSAAAQPSGATDAGTDPRAGAPRAKGSPSGGRGARGAPPLGSPLGGSPLTRAQQKRQAGEGRPEKRLKRGDGGGAA